MYHNPHPPLPLLNHPKPLDEADFVVKVKIIRERLESKESEVHGRWLTEEQLKKSKEYTATQIRNIISYCRKFPESLIRTGVEQ